MSTTPVTSTVSSGAPTTPAAPAVTPAQPAAAAPAAGADLKALNDRLTALEPARGTTYATSSAKQGDGTGTATQPGNRGGRLTEGGEEDEERNDNERPSARTRRGGRPGDDGKPMNEQQGVAKYKARAKKGVSMK